MTGVTNHNHLLDKIVGDAAALKPLVIACLDDNPENRPSVTQVSVVIKEAKEKCKYDEKDPVVWLTQVLQPQEKQKDPQQQQVCIATCVCMLKYALSIDVLSYWAWYCITSFIDNAIQI